MGRREYYFSCLEEDSFCNPFLRPVGLKACMVRAYEYVDGVEDILCSLKQNNYEVHAFTNYPVW